MLIEDNGDIKVDFPTAYKYANIVASKSHTFGTHIFASMNDYKLGNVLDSCDVSIEFYKSVAERNLLSRKMLLQAADSYQKGNYRTSSLLYAELAEEGHQFSEMNIGLLFYNHKIFNNQTFNDYNSHKYFSRLHTHKDPLATLFIGDMYYTG